ncbi:MAG: DUF721 domain-containing protein [Candidatus Omnitrophica bacterium]|jgi:hypothetical protein|nr:DUF721 domain-containing protein [Candidatus Omnitrophota bacterium]MDD5080021.1 DUF721 domain-containing protein [Candidatus Omnitrophota bacterium]
MEPIKNSVLSLLSDLKAKKQGSGFLYPDGLLKRGFAKKELKHIKFGSVKNGILYITVDSPVWAYYLNMQKKRILTRLAAGPSGIKDVRFKIGDVGEGS